MLNLWILLVTLAASPEGTLAVTVGAEQEQRQIHLVDVETGTWQVAGEGKGAGAPVWSPDGSRLAYSSLAQNSGTAIRIIDGDSLNETVLQHAHTWNRDLQWSPDSRYVCYSTGNSTGLERRLAVYDIEEGTENIWGGELGRTIVQAPLAGLLQPIWLTEPKLVLALDPEAKVELEGVDMDQLRDEGSLSDFAIFTGAMPKALLAIGVFGVPGKYSTEPVLVTENQVVPILPLLPDAPQSSRYMEWGLAINQKGDRIIFESNDGGDRELFLLGSRGLANISNHRAADWNPVWGEGSQEILFESFRHGRRGVYKVIADTGRVSPLAIADTHDAWAPSWGPGDAWVAYVSDATGEPMVYLCTGNGEERQALPGATAPSFAPAWRPEAEEED